MGITVEDLTELPHLGLKVIAGADGLDTPVEWAHVSEWDRIARWLDPGTLLISIGINLPFDAASQIDFVSELADHRICGFAIDIRHSDRLTAEVLEEANRRAFPILTVATPTPLSQIVRIVASATLDQERRRLLTHIRVLDVLHESAQASAPAGAVFEQLGRATGYLLSACGVHGDALLPGVPVPEEPIVEALRAGGLEGELKDEVRVCTIVAAGGVRGYLVARERPRAKPAGLVALQYIATVAAQECRCLDAERAAQKRFLEEDLGDALVGELAETTLRRRLGSVGIDLSGPCRIVAISAGDDTAAELLERLDRERVPHLAARVGELYVLLGAGDWQVLHGARSESHIGVSGEFEPDVDAVQLARREADLALRFVARSGERTVGVWDDVEYSIALDPDEDSLRRLVNAVLGPLLRYDRKHQTDLVRSLRVYLEHERRLGDAASYLCVHPNTLVYRLKRIEQLSGLKLSSIGAQTDYWLATEAYRLLHPEADERIRLGGADLARRAG